MTRPSRPAFELGHTGATDSTSTDPPLTGRDPAQHSIDDSAVTAASTPSGLDAHRRAVDVMLSGGAEFATVERSVVDALLPDTDRDALWVYSWSRASLRDRQDFTNARRTATARSGRTPRRVNGSPGTGCR
jgi:hypothetical protein